MIEWKDAEVSDHSSGITDLITASTPDYQEICENLTHNVKLQILSSRDGYRRFTEEPTDQKIQQLFKLEDWIIAFCYDDPLLDTDTIQGHLYFRLESDTVSPWTKVPTPKDRTTSVIFRIVTKDGKGMTMTKGAPIYNQIVVKAGSNGGGPNWDPDISVLTDTIYVTVDTGRLRTNLMYDITGPVSSGLPLEWSSFAALFTGWTVTLLPGTLPNNAVIFDGDLTVQTVATSPGGYYPASVRSDGNGAEIAFITEQGHLQSSEWQSHLYLAFEPFIKTYSPNLLDPYGKDPATYPPDNNRLPLRKIAPVSSPVGVDPIVYTPSAINGQLPGTLIGQDFTEYVYSESVRYQVHEIRLELGSSATDQTATIEIWAERTWGRVHPTMDDMQYLELVTLSTENKFYPEMPFFLVDPNIIFYFPGDYGSITPKWGKLTLVYHSKKDATNARKPLTFQEAVDAINEAFREYNSRAIQQTLFVYYAAYESFGYYLKQNPKSKPDEVINGTMFMENVFFTDSIPEDIPGNFQYGYSFYLRQSYQGQFEGAPRDFIFDGPASFIQVRTLSPLGSDLLKGYGPTTPAPTPPAAITPDLSTLKTYSPSPIVYGGILVSITQGDSLLDQSNLEGVFARTLDGGDVYYIDEETRQWIPTGDLVLPENLMEDDWDTKTAFVVPHQSHTDDDALQFNEPAYINGGTLSYDSLPQGPYYFTIINQVGFHANVVNNIQRVYDSVPGIPQSAPATSFNDFDDEITGISSYLDRPIVPTQNRLWRIEGQRAADGTGRLFLRTISDEYGCIANQSIVVTNTGVFLWSNTGIVYTDGLKAFRVSEHLIERYNSWLSTVRGGQPTIGPKQLRGRYDELNRLVFWSLYDENGEPFFVVLSLQKGITPTMPITVHRGIRYRSVDRTTGAIEDFDYFLTHATLYSDDYQRWYRGQGRFLLMADPSRTFDESDVDDLMHPIVPLYKSIAFSHGSPLMRKQTSRVMLNLRDMTNNGVSLQPLGWNDLSETANKMIACLNYQHIEWSPDYATVTPFDLEQFFKHTDARWNSDTLVSYKRGFGRGMQRQCYKQFGFTALKLKFMELSIETAGIESLQITYKNGFPEPTVVIRVLGVTLPPELDDGSGRFYVSWDGVMEPQPISGIENDGTYDYITALTGGDPNTDPDLIVLWPKIKIYRLFTDQRIDLLGYNLTFRLIGDRTHGQLKSNAKGGVSA